jgi:RHH-type transcriptional regulator, rel operon repressor / antitoxin RelB
MNADKLKHLHYVPALSSTDCYTCIAIVGGLCMLALRLPPEIEERLGALARKTGRSESYYAREAILRQIEDIEDDHLARRRLARGGSRVTLESLERDITRRTKR